jgi:hypothetical protein
MALTKKDYYEYIKSEKWQETRKRYYNSKLYKTFKSKKKGWNCYCCSASDVPLDLHHRSYKRLGEENIAIDLVTVCRECHEKIHHLMKESNVSLWKATKKIKSRHTKKQRKEKIKNGRLI